MGEKTGNSQHPILQKHIKQSCSGNTSFHIMWIWFLVLTLLITLSSKFSVFSLRRKKEKKKSISRTDEALFSFLFFLFFFWTSFWGRKEGNTTLIFRIYKHKNISFNSRQKDQNRKFTIFPQEYLGKISNTLLSVTKKKKKKSSWLIEFGNENHLRRRWERQRVKLSTIK